MKYTAVNVGHSLSHNYAIKAHCSYNSPVTCDVIVPYFKSVKLEYLACIQEAIRFWCVHNGRMTELNKTGGERERERERGGGGRESASWEEDGG